MITLEQVEELRKKANVSYDEAKEALEASNGDLLDAVIYLEKKGKVTPPQGGGYYSSGERHENANDSGSTINSEKYDKSAGESCGELLKRFWSFLCGIVHKGNINDFEIYKDNVRKASIPITLLAILVIFAFWITFPLIIIGLFFGLRYRFNGPDFHKSTVNNVMDTAANTADDIKKSFKNNN